MICWTLLRGVVENEGRSALLLLGVVVVGENRINADLFEPIIIGGLPCSFFGPGGGE